MSWRYEGYDAAGKLRTGTIDASGEDAAREHLRKQNIFVTTLSESNAAARPASAKGGRKMRAGTRLRNLVIFTRELSVLIASGTTVVDALTALENQARDPAWKSIVGDIRRAVEQGASLAEAMESHPRVFDAVTRSLVNAGESSGGLEGMLERLASVTRQRAHIRSSVGGALVYPTLLISVSSAVLVVMMTVVLPRFTGLFETLDVPLPPTTRFLMGIGEFVRGWWWAVLLAGAGSIVAAWTWVHTPRGRDCIDSFVIRAPLVGRIVRNFSVARTTRVLGILIVSRVPLLDALRLTREATANRRFVEVIAGAEDAVTRGEPISAAFAASDLFPPAIAEAIRNGESSGNVGPVLSHIANHLDEDNEVILRSLTSILEPVILIGLGVVVAFVAISMFLPLFDLTAMAQGGG